MGIITKTARGLGLVALLVFPALLIQSTSNSVFVAEFAIIAQRNLVLYVPSLVLLKASSIVYPPLPGVVLTLASVPLIGWEPAYVIDIIGSGLGASTAYFLGKKYGYAILEKVVGQPLTEKIRHTQLKRTNQVEAAIVLRFATGGLLSDGLAWGSSLIGFRYKSFIVGYLISHIITTLPIFYLVGVSMSFDSWIIVSAVTITAWLVMYKFKGRYFE